MSAGEVLVRLAPALQVKRGETRRSREHKREAAPLHRGCSPLEVQTEGVLVTVTTVKGHQEERSSDWKAVSN